MQEGLSVTATICLNLLVAFLCFAAVQIRRMTHTLHVLGTVAYFDCRNTVFAVCRMLGGMAGVPPHMALAYQLSGMSLSGPAARPSNGSMSMVQLMPHAYAPAATAAPAMAVIGTDSKTIKIRGLPFRATPLDIFNFFENYDVIAESLQLGVDALGRPSGEAWLTFTSSEEALRAVRERNRHYLGNRYLELSLT
eukprot:GHRR01016309.1.p1 GENE.GHRR01016309.1~~GHRR01016309.1.p1  ORF type:complete len:194 (+),score=47.29 GHRR01016309.1:267-848(+)